MLISFSMGQVFPAGQDKEREKEREKESEERKTRTFFCRESLPETHVLVQTSRTALQIRGMLRRYMVDLSQ